MSVPGTGAVGPPCTVEGSKAPAVALAELGVIWLHSKARGVWLPSCLWASWAPGPLQCRGPSPAGHLPQLGPPLLCHQSVCLSTCPQNSYGYAAVATSVAAVPSKTPGSTCLKGHHGHPKASLRELCMHSARPNLLLDPRGARPTSEPSACLRRASLWSTYCVPRLSTRAAF